jgi:hypothetical protein
LATCTRNKQSNTTWEKGQNKKERKRKRTLPLPIIILLKLESFSSTKSLSHCPELYSATCVLVIYAQR